MKVESCAADNPAETTAEKNRPEPSSGVGNINKIVADKLHLIAKTISRKAESPDAKPEVVHYGKQASEMLEQSADYLQELDYATAEASVRDYVKKNPGRSLIIAGIAGLAIGALLRRR